MEVRTGTYKVQKTTRKKSERNIADYQPTCENMLIDFAKIIGAELPAGICLKRLRLHETATSYAEWCAEDNV